VLKYKHTKEFHISAPQVHGYEVSNSTFHKIAAQI